MMLKPKSNWIGEQEVKKGGELKLTLTEMLHSIEEKRAMDRQESVLVQWGALRSHVRERNQSIAGESFET